MTFVRNTWILFKTLFKVTFGEKEVKGKRKANPKIFMPILGALIAAYIAFITFSLVSGVAPYDTDGLVISALLGATQLVVMFFGMFATINFLYFSKDAQQLAALPVSSGTIFAAKILLTYVCELAICAAISLPALLTYGIFKSVVLGFSAVGVGYFIYALLSVFVLPVIPILIVSVVSLPLMYIVSYFKKHNVANIIFSVLLALVFTGVMVFVQIYINSGSAMRDAETVDVAATMATYGSIDKILIFNYPLRMAFVAKSGLSVLWFLAYVGVVVGCGAIAIFISRLLYGNVVERGFETGSSSKKKKSVKEVVYKSSSFKKTFLKKEIRTFVNAPALFMNFIIPALVLPICAVAFGVAFGSAAFAESTEGAEDFSVFYVVFPMFVYMSVMLVCFSNFLASIGFSREGKNFLTLKTLPVSGRVITKLKMELSFVLTVIMSIDAAISLIILSVIIKADVAAAAIAVVGLFVFDILVGVGYDMMALGNDMRKLNINWQTLTEITKKNSATVLVQMLAMVVGLLSMVIIILLYVFLPWPVVASTSLAVGVMFVMGVLMLIMGYKRLNKNPDKWFAEVEA